MIGILFASGNASVSILLFLFSGLLLAAGVAAKARSHAFRLAFLEHMPLNKIEYTHPHIPSARAIVTIAFCSAALLFAGLQTIQGVFPFDDPYQGLNLASFFLIATSVGILAELKWKGSKEYISAFLIGTSLAFLTLVIEFGSTRSFAYSFFPFVLLLPTVLLVGYAFAGKNRRGAIMTLVLSFGFWMFMYLIQ